MVMKCKTSGPVRGSSTPARSLHQLLPGRRRAAGGGGWRGEGTRAAAAAGLAPPENIVQETIRTGNTTPDLRPCRPGCVWPRDRRGGAGGAGCPTVSQERTMGNSEPGQDMGGWEEDVTGMWRREEVEGGVIGAASTWGRGRRAPWHTVNTHSRRTRWYREGAAPGVARWVVHVATAGAAPPRPRAAPTRVEVWPVFHTRQQYCGRGRVWAAADGAGRGGVGAVDCELDCDQRTGAVDGLREAATGCGLWGRTTNINNKALRVRRARIGKARPTMWGSESPEGWAAAPEPEARQGGAGRGGAGWGGRRGSRSSNK
ncbi:hypothetical protein E2C01_005300 [Portunus trituberculatus]|uniref:Uncharacterized protein n=1 Tax=Portunus trituberculatus TaxID=210409 RepID=A0A5B7CS63_PORTR|nr:hypothetical protein [Portunus trituberculatus]